MRRMMNRRGSGNPSLACRRCLLHSHLAPRAPKDPPRRLSAHGGPRRRAPALRCLSGHFRPLPYSRATLRCSPRPVQPQSIPSHWHPAGSAIPPQRRHQDLLQTRHQQDWSDRRHARRPGRDVPTLQQARHCPGRPHCAARRSCAPAQTAPVWNLTYRSSRRRSSGRRGPNPATGPEDLNDCLRSGGAGCRGLR